MVSIDTMISFGILIIGIISLIVAIIKLIIKK